MLYNENLREEEQHLIQQIAEQTERGKIDWELTEYNPLSFLSDLQQGSGRAGQAKNENAGLCKEFYHIHRKVL